MARLLTYKIGLFIVVFLIMTNTLKSQATTQLSILDSYSFTDTFQTVLYIDSFATVGAITVSVNYDESKLELLNVQQDVAFTNNFYQNVVNSELFLAWFNTTPVSQVDTFAVLTFKKKADFCETPLSWGAIRQVSDSVGTTLDTDYHTGSVFFLTEEKPDLVSPLPNQVGIPINSIFRWQDYDLSCVADYHFQLALDSNFTQRLIDTLITDSFFVATNLPELTTNYWRVAKVDQQRNEYWSSYNVASTKSIDTTIIQLPTVISWNDTVNIVVDLTNNEPIGIMDLGIEYDTTALQFLDFSNALLTNLNVKDTLGQIQLLWQANAEPLLLPSDTLIELQFVRKTACTPTLNWSANSAFYYNDNTTQVANLLNGSITFTDSLTSNLLFPNNTNTEVFIRPELTWEAVYCGNGYQLQVSQDPNFSTILIDTFTTDTTYIPTILQGDSTYYWRVGWYNKLDSLYWTSAWSFTTESVLPITVTAQPMVTEDSTFYLPITIDSLANAIGFELFLNYDTAAVQYVGFIDTTTLLSGLDIQNHNGTVSIRWNAIDSTIENTANIPSDTLLQLQFNHLDGCETVFAWQTDTSDFYHINTTINIDGIFTNAVATFLQNETPQLIPTAPIPSIHPDFSWQALNCVENYHFQIALDASFTQLISNEVLSDTTIWQPNLTPNTTYFWRVAKEDFVGDFFWSDTLSFTTADAYTTHFALDSTLTYQTTDSIALVVDSLFFVNGLEIEINYDANEIRFDGLTDSLFTNLTVLDNNGLLTISWQDTTAWHDLLQDTLVVLQFTELNACKTSISFNNIQLNFRNDITLNHTLNTKNGSIEYLNSTSPTILTPIADATDVYPIVDFSWGVTDCAVAYQFQVAQDSLFTDKLIDTLLTNLFFNDLLLNHSSTYYWRVGRWDTQNDLYWSDTSKFETTLLPVIQVAASDVITYNDTMQVGISLEDVVWAESFALALTYDTTDFDYIGFVDTSFVMDIFEQDGTILLQWMAEDLSFDSWLNIDTDTIVRLSFLSKDGCYTDLNWDVALTNFDYKTPSISTFTNNINGSIEWVNNDIPLLIYPPNDTAFLPTSFVMSWDAVLCAENYVVQVATDSAFEALVIDAANILTENYIIEDLQNYTTYFWRVGQQDSEGMIHWSIGRTFRTDIQSEATHTIFPNPVEDVLNVWFDSELSAEATLTMYNSIGQLMGNWEVQQSTKQFRLPVARFDKGLYLLHFEQGDVQWVEKVLVR